MKYTKYLEKVLVIKKHFLKYVFCEIFFEQSLIHCIAPILQRITLLAKVQNF